MRRKIQRSMNAVILAALFISYILIGILVYTRTLDALKAETRLEADYIKEAISISGTSYLEDMDLVQSSTRITLIEPDGEVLYDQNQADVKLENHNDRKEVLEARENGDGEDIRSSQTVGKKTYYYAIDMGDGHILRVAKTIDNIWPTFLEVLPYMIVIFVVMILFGLFISKIQTERLIQPINELDLENPLENDVYEELTPLLQSIDKQNREKEMVANMRKEFSANVSHELKTPLTSISGYAEIMKSGLVKPEDMKGFSERIYNEASRLITLVEDILKISKLDEGNVTLEKEPVELYGLCREICSRLSHQAEKNRIHVEVVGEPVEYMGIRQILDEMIYNICENGIKYNSVGGTLSVWAGNTLKGPKIIVKDTGIGIPAEEQERIFERFYRVDKSHSRQIGGTGLGLSIVKHGALLHGIDIHVESEVGQGTKIELDFNHQ